MKPLPVNSAKIRDCFLSVKTKFAKTTVKENLLTQMTWSQQKKTESKGQETDNSIVINVLLFGF